MKENKILIYAVIISLLLHTMAIFYILSRPVKKHKPAKIHHYTKPIMVEPYKFIKNYLKNIKNIPKAKYASTIAHKALKNMRLNAPPSYKMLAPTLPPQQALNSRNNRLNNTVNNRKAINSSHIFAQKGNITKPREKLSNLYYPNNYPNAINNGIYRNSGIQNPSHGVKSATVNLNTTTIKFASYLLHVKEKIENVWEYPIKARKEGLSGHLIIEFSINKNGSIYKVKLLRSSGKKVLDMAAIKAIYNAARYNSFPPYWTIKRLNIIGTFIYYLNNFYVY